MTVVIWLLLFAPAGDDRQFVVRAYTSQAQCEDVLDGIVRTGLALEDEVKCERKELTAEEAKLWKPL